MTSAVLVLLVIHTDPVYHRLASRPHNNLYEQIVKRKETRTSMRDGVTVAPMSPLVSGDGESIFSK